MSGETLAMIIPENKYPLAISRYLAFIGRIVFLFTEF